jgi:hypothetical protein
MVGGWSGWAEGSRLEIVISVSNLCIASLMRFNVRIFVHID